MECEQNVTRIVLNRTTKIRHAYNNWHTPLIDGHNALGKNITE